MFKILKSPSQTSILALMAILVASVLSVGYHSFDEQFQILEFAGLKLGLNQPETMTWEYREQMRPTIQPLFTILLFKVYSFLGLKSPFLFVFFLRVISGLLGFCAIKRVWRYLATEYKLKNRQLLVFLVFLIFPVLYNAVRVSSENWAGIFFTLGFTAYFLEKSQFKKITYAGLGLGLAFLFRYQAGFLILGFGLWLLFIKREQFKWIAYLGGILLLAVLFGFLLDRIYYGEWVWSVYNYFEQNLLEDKVSGFGVDPWYWYLTETTVRLIPPFSLIFIIGLVYGYIKKYKHPIIWSMAPFLLIHFLIGHKEIRFLFPLLYFLPFLGILGVECLQLLMDKFSIKKGYYKWFKYLFILVYSVALIVIITKPADPRIGLYKGVYHATEKPAILYYLDKDPYHPANEIFFYRRQNLKTKRVASVEEINLQTDSTVFLAYSNRDKLTEEVEGEIVYRTFPEWINVINVGGWLDRTKQWKVTKMN